ncbi:Gfo/Idh/MocA family protein [Arthrobacter sp. 2RAF6]|uniref:Gfo/Idh/MocA family protein n=1 Tax=Arthrobacter sp. 2RAF6 TaxID=3233002 RepID=UPI003F911FB0
MSQLFGIALVGCGALADILLKDVYPHVEGMEVRAVVDRDVERAKLFGTKLGIPYFQTLEEAANKVDFEAFDLRVPHHLHADSSIEAMRLGKHVLVEKPMATDGTEAQRMLSESARTGKVLAVGENYDYLECVQMAKQVLASGEIGRPVHAEVSRLFQLGPEWRRTGWRGSDGGVGGVLMENGCHIARLVEHLLGRIVDVSAFQNFFVTEEVTGDSVAVAFQTDRGVIGTQSYSWTVGVPRFSLPEIRVIGDEGYLEVWVDYVGQRSGVRVCTASGEGRWIPAPQMFYTSLVNVMESFIDGCRGGSLAGITPEAGLADVEVVDRIFAAIRTHSLQ